MTSTETQTEYWVEVTGYGRVSVLRVKATSEAEAIEKAFASRGISAKVKSTA